MRFSHSLNLTHSNSRIENKDTLKNMLHVSWFPQINFCDWKYMKQIVVYLYISGQI